MGIHLISKNVLLPLEPWGDENVMGIRAFNKKNWNISEKVWKFWPILCTWHQRLEGQHWRTVYTMCHSSALFLISLRILPVSTYKCKYPVLDLKIQVCWGKKKHLGILLPMLPMQTSPYFPITSHNLLSLHINYIPLRWQSWYTE